MTAGSAGAGTAGVGVGSAAWASDPRSKLPRPKPTLRRPTNLTGIFPMRLALPWVHSSVQQMFGSLCSGCAAPDRGPGGRIPFRRRRSPRSRDHLLPELLYDLGSEPFAVNEHHVLAIVEPEPMTRNPFDRLLPAQCQAEGLRLVTIDRMRLRKRWRRDAGATFMLDRPTSEHAKQAKSLCSTTSARAFPRSRYSSARADSTKPCRAAHIILVLLEASSRCPPVRPPKDTGRRDYAWTTELSLNGARNKIIAPQESIRNSIESLSGTEYLM